MRIVVLADTHLHHGLVDRLPKRVLQAIGAADHVLHAGDIVSEQALGELCDLAPTTAVLGNNDHQLNGQLPERVELELDGVRVAMVHDSGARHGREARLAQAFPSADVVVFGHSHVPVNALGTGGQVLFNPGSATTRRAQPRCSFGVFDLETGSLVRHEIEYL